MNNYESSEHIKIQENSSPRSERSALPRCPGAEIQNSASEKLCSRIHRTYLPSFIDVVSAVSESRVLKYLMLTPDGRTFDRFYKSSQERWVIQQQKQAMWPPGSADMVCPRPPPTLIFDRLTLKLICQSHPRWGTFLPNLGTVYAFAFWNYSLCTRRTDRQTYSQTKATLIAPCYGQGHNKQFL